MPTPRKPSRSARAGWALATCAAALGMYSLLMGKPANLVHTEPSDFSPVLVFDDAGQRCMNFETIKDDGRQTCFDLKDPDKMVFPYTRMMTSALFAQPAPENILIIGLGGATIQNALRKIIPAATIDSVEIDPAVARVAERYFAYEPGPQQRLFVEDGRAFIEQARREGRHYDMVMLDAFDVDYIPAHLLTREFLEHVQAILSPDGILVANTFTRSVMYDQESATYAAVFGDFFSLHAGNRVIIATRGPLPDSATLARNAAALADTLAPFGIDVQEELQRYSSKRDWNEKAAVLTD